MSDALGPYDCSGLRSSSEELWPPPLHPPQPPMVEEDGRREEKRNQVQESRLEVDQEGQACMESNKLCIYGSA